MSTIELSPAEAHALAELIHTVLPAAFSQGLGEPMPPADRDRLLRDLDRWFGELQFHPTDLLGLAVRLRRAGDRVPNEGYTGSAPASAGIMRAAG